MKVILAVDNTFDTYSFEKFLVEAEKEVVAVYHHGHVPSKPKEHVHAINGDCSTMCKLIAETRRAKEYIDELLLVPQTVEHILVEYKGYEVLPAIKDMLNKLETKAITLKELTEYHGSESSCECSFCLSSDTLKKFGIPGQVKSSKVLSIKSLAMAVPGSMISLFDNIILSKTFDGFWLNPAKLTKFKSDQFVNLIISGNVTWVQHNINADDIQPTEEQEEIPLTETPDWATANSPVKSYEELLLAPTGVSISSSILDWEDCTYIKQSNGLWKNKASSKDQFETGTFSNVVNYGYVWKTPEPETQAAKLLKQWEKTYPASSLSF